MFRCPSCHGNMEYVPSLVTDCCGLELEDDTESCPGCGNDEPLLIEGEPRLQCENCGYIE